MEPPAFDNDGHAAAVRALNVVIEGEECVTAQTNAGNFGKPYLFLGCSQSTNTTSYLCTCPLLDV
jgi:hypothetical protein